MTQHRVPAEVRPPQVGKISIPEFNDIHEVQVGALTLHESNTFDYSYQSTRKFCISSSDFHLKSVLSQLNVLNGRHPHHLLPDMSQGYL